VDWAFSPDGKRIVMRLARLRKIFDVLDSCDTWKGRCDTLPDQPLPPEPLSLVHRKGKVALPEARVEAVAKRETGGQEPAKCQHRSVIGAWVRP
jgi:hypothetical protein